VDQIAIIIPSYNEGDRLYSTVKELNEFLSADSVRSYSIIIIDDASNPRVEWERLEKQVRTYLITHPINLGQGAALNTGFKYCREKLFPDFVVTLDADGQHDHKDIPKFVEYSENKSLDIVFGNRFQEGKSNVPPFRHMILKLAMIFERWVTGLRLNDAHNGFRVIKKNALAVLTITQNGMAHATEIKQVIAKHRLQYDELPTTITYSEDTLTKGQSSMGSFKILKDLLKNHLFARVS
jgi:glycosyltransferase involved in cell wall biosynthesis